MPAWSPRRGRSPGGACPGPSPPWLAEPAPWCRRYGDQRDADPAELVYVPIHVAQVGLASRAVEAAVELDHRPAPFVGKPPCADVQGLDLEWRGRRLWVFARHDHHSPLDLRP